jgi:Flp pilus assembly protein TadD
MVRRLITVLLLVAVPTLAMAASRSEVYREAKEATALIVAVNDTTHSISLGSGFFVDSDGLLLTNAHVVEDHTRLFVYVRDQQVYPAPQVVIVDPDLDLAALRIPLKEKAATLTLAQRPPEEGEEVIAVGYPRITDILQMGFVLHPTVASGHANGIAPGRSRMNGRNTPFIQTTSNFNFGNSGGPLVSLQTHEAVGMVVHTVPYLERAKDRNGTSIGSVTMKSGIGYSIPATVIRRWLAANRLAPDTTLRILPKSGEVESGPRQEANRAFATGHLLHTLAMVLQQDADLLGLAAYHYQNAAAVRQDAPWITRNLGLVSASLGQWDRALRAYQQALQLTPNDSALLADMALAWDRTGNRERALEAYRAALQANPRSELAHNNLGALYLKIGRLEEAIHEFRQALSSNAGSAIASYNLGVSLEAKGLREDALTAWETFLRKSGPGPDMGGFRTKMRENIARLKPVIAKAQPVSGSP